MNRERAIAHNRRPLTRATGLMGLSVVLRLLAIVVWPAVVAAMVVPVPLAELAREADLIVRARVVDVDSAWNADQSAMYSDVTLQVVEVVSATSPANAPAHLTLRVAGGRIGAQEMRTSVDPVFAPGGEGFFLLHESATSAAFTLVGQSQGYFPIEGGMVMVSGAKMSIGDFAARLAGD